MKSLPEEYAKQLEGHIEELSECLVNMENNVTEVNKKIEDLNDTIQSYNNTLKNVGDLRDSVVQQMKDHFAGQSEEWCEGAEGEEYTGWIDAWESLDTEPLDLADEVAVADKAKATLETIDEMPESPE